MTTYDLVRAKAEAAHRAAAQLAVTSTVIKNKALLAWRQPLKPRYLQYWRLMRLIWKQAALII